MKISVEVDGVNQAIGALRMFAVAGRERTAEAILTSAKEIRAGARNRVHSRTGRFRRRIGYRVSKDGLSARIAAWGRGGNRPDPVSHLLEFGTKAHVIVPKKKSGRRAIKIGAEGGIEGGAYRAAVHHPGAAAKPWLFPAWEDERPHYVDRVAAAINRAGQDAAR